MRYGRRIYRLVIIVLVFGVSGCIFLPGGRVVDSAMVVHTAGSSQSTTSARLPVEATKVYSAFARVIDGREDIEIVSRNDNAYMIEVVGDFGGITAQVTSLGPREALLYIWADTKGTGRLGSEVASSAVEAVCDELGVSYETVRL